MERCPYFKESFLSGNTCSAKGREEYISTEHIQYCGGQVLSADYHKCPIYQEVTGANRSGGCYLTSACMSKQGDLFEDDCQELTILRKFRDTYVKDNYPKDIDTYYSIAPKIVEKIEKLPDCNEIFNRIYDELVRPCCELILNNKKYEAYENYKNYSLTLYKKYVNN